MKTVTSQSVGQYSGAGIAMVVLMCMSVVKSMSGYHQTVMMMMSTRHLSTTVICALQTDRQTMCVCDDLTTDIISHTHTDTETSM